MKKMTNRIFTFFSLVVVLSGCRKDLNFSTIPGANLSGNLLGSTLVQNFFASKPVIEDFEIGNKIPYAASDVTLSTGIWYLDDALIGISPSDGKEGKKSVRIREAGSIYMKFDVTNGASIVSIEHAIFGTDGSSTWALSVSNDGGSTYSRTGSIITTSSTTLQTASFAINTAGNLRFKIEKLSGGSNRINIDNITIEPYITVPDNDNLLLGNPSDAAHITDSINNYLMIKPYYDLSYSRDRGTPNWVSWHLYKNDVNSTIPRVDRFRKDTALPIGWFQVGGTYPTGCGFDRGHHCPSADRKSDSLANDATCLMTNIAPQAPNNNRNTWKNMENYIRTQVGAGNEAYIVMGSYGVGGTGSSGYATTINSGHITVPSNIWKVVVLIPNGDNDLNRIDTNTRVIAVITPNDNSISSDWKTYRTSVKAIEAATGYNLLSNLPVPVQKVIEARVDNK